MEPAMIPVPAVIKGTDITVTAADTVVETLVAHMAVGMAVVAAVAMAVVAAIKVKSSVLKK
jgi:hypothetical protein